MQCSEITELEVDRNMYRRLWTGQAEVWPLMAMCYGHKSKGMLPRSETDRVRNF